ncbi:DUF1488 family protein [Caballeronia choica]|uniref:DUF1488 family protein n=1 Tax=Caballeronia choica TaxID=326476 RepID=UPI000B3E8003
MVSHGGEAVEFEIEIRGKRLPCSVAREALEDHFWLARQADDARLLRAFADGRKRIVAMAEQGSSIVGRGDYTDVTGFRTVGPTQDDAEGRHAGVERRSASVRRSDERTECEGSRLISPGHPSSSSEAGIANPIHGGPRLDGSFHPSVCFIPSIN